MKRKKIKFFYLLLSVVFGLVLYSIYVYRHSPYYKYIACAKKNCEKINIFFGFRSYRFYNTGIPKLNHSLYRALKQQQGFNLYTQGIQTAYLKHYLPIIYKGLPWQKKISKDIIKYTDVFLSSNPNDSNVTFFINSCYKKQNLKIYTILNDMYAVNHLHENKIILDKIRHCLTMPSGDICERFILPLDRYIAIKNMDGIFTISTVSAKDLELFFPDTKKIPKYLIHLPVPNDIPDADFRLKAQLLTDKDKKNSEKVDFFIKHQQKYILMSAAKSFIPISNIVKKINKKYPNLNLKLALFSKRKDGMGFIHVGNNQNMEVFNFDQDHFYLDEYLASKDLDKLFDNALVYINNNFYEGYGLDTLKAMQHGIPVIVNDAGANSEVIANGGYVVKNKKNCKLMRFFSKPFLREGYCEVDYQDMYNVIEKLATNDSFRQTMIQKSKKEFKKKDLSWEKIAQKMYTVMLNDCNKNH